MNEIVENLIDEVLGFNWHQLLVLFVCAYGFLIAQLNLLFLIFASARPEYKCYGFDNIVDEFGIFHGANETFTLLRCPPIAGQMLCSNVTIVEQFSSVNRFFNIDCQHSVYIKYMAVTQLIGMTIGLPVICQFADMWGRKWTCFSSLLGLMLAGGFSIFSPTWVVFVVFRFFVGFFLGGLMTISYVFILEYVSKFHRMWITGLLLCTGQVGYVISGYITKSWWYFSIFSNAIGIPLLILMIFINESPVWLLQHGQLAKAEKQLRSIKSKFNSKFSPCCGSLTYKITPQDLKDVLVHYVHEVDHPPKDFTLLYFIANKKFGIRSAVMWFSWFVCGFVTFTIFRMCPQLSPNIYLNLLYYMLFRVLAAAAMFILDVSIRPFGRKAMHFISVLPIILCAVTILIIILIGKREQLKYWTSVLDLIIFGVTGPWWLVLYVRSAEMVPTAIRCITAGLCSSFTRIAAMAGPEILALTLANHIYVIYVLIAIFCIADLVMSMVFLPETKQHPLRTADCTTRFTFYSNTIRSNSFNLIASQGLLSAPRTSTSRSTSPRL